MADWIKGSSRRRAECLLKFRFAVVVYFSKEGVHAGQWNFD